MRRAAVDANQAAIVGELRDAGCTVQHLHKVGEGCPDIAVGHRSTNYFFEIKDGSKPPSAQKLRPLQQKWHDEWKGQVCTITTAEEALSAMGIWGRV